MHMNTLPRIRFAQLPTPLEEMNRLSDLLGGPRLLIKRDDQTGLALGGNKTRKLEFLIADALAKKADTILTAGAAQSNHCRQTAAAAARVGLRCDLILGGEQPEVPNGNLLLDRLLGATIHWTRTELRVERMDELARELRQKSSANARISRELAGMDTKKEEAEFLEYTQASEADDEFDALIGLAKKESASPTQQKDTPIPEA